MLLRKYHIDIQFAKLFKLVIGMALVIQITIVTYNHFSGYHVLENYTEFAIRIVRGFAFSTFGGLIIAYWNLIFIGYLNRRMPWRNGVVRRIFVQFIILLIIAIAMAVLQTIVAHLISRYRQDFFNVMWNNIFIYSVINMLFMTILEAWIFLEESDKEKIRREKLQQELILEAESRAAIEAQIKIEEEKSKLTQELVEQEKMINQSLEQEIQKRETITRRLHESREQLKSLLSNLIGAAYRCRFDSHHTMLYVSDKIFDISGYAAMDFMGETKMDFESIIFPDDQPLCKKIKHEAALENKHFDLEYRIIHKNGEIIWVNENGICVFDHHGELQYLDGIIYDITARKKAEQAAIESERRYKDLMDFLPQPVFELSLEGEVVLTNKAGDEFFGPVTNEKGKRTTVFDCFTKEDFPKIIENLKRSTQGLTTEPGEFTAIKKDGSLCPVLIFGNLIVQNGKITGRRGIIIDISERKNQELRLLKAKVELEKMNNTLEQRVSERTKQLTEAKIQLMKVQKENLQTRFEVLKQQVNPHFLFNSLNVLTSLIKVDADLAESFVERLSKVYRYVLENKEKELVTLGTELEFLKAYLFLLETRFLKKLVVDVKIERENYEFQILPMAIQLIIENAIKHNTFSRSEPLRISIFVDESRHLNIINNLNERESKLVSTGVGLQNIRRRYLLLSDRKPEFQKTKEHFIVKLPLFEPVNSRTE